MEMLQKTEVIAIFCDFLAYFCINFGCHGNAPRPLQSECLLWIGRPQKPIVMSNHILVISWRNAFIAIFCPKIGCLGNAPLSLVFGSVTYDYMNSQMAQTLSRNQTLHGYVAYN